ncbi:MAG TPA: TetR/AcrR family transcriptional regulator [Solirubrobacterales bacterium]|nr:TetR/AcrR family transcriptional regulator [Solirubrobacterales bacterium]
MVATRVALRQEARRREVLTAATAVFSARGYRASAMSDVAEELGMGKASLYHYVGSKEEILVELYEDVLRENVIAARRIADSDRPARQALHDLIADRAAYTCRNRDLLRVFFENEAELPAREQARLIAVRNEYEQTLLDLLARGAAADEFALPTTPGILVNTALGAANWAYKWYRPDGPLTPEQLGAEIASLVLASLTAP